LEDPRRKRPNRPSAGAESVAKHGDWHADGRGVTGGQADARQSPYRKNSPPAGRIGSGGPSDGGRSEGLGNNHRVSLPHGNYRLHAILDRAYAVPFVDC